MLGTSLDAIWDHSVPYSEGEIYKDTWKKEVLAENLGMEQESAARLYSVREVQMSMIGWDIGGGFPLDILASLSQD